MEQRLNINPNTEEFKDFLEQSYSFFADSEHASETPDQALVWVMMLAAVMVETMSDQSKEERKRLAATYLEQVHSTFQSALVFDDDDVGVPQNKRMI